MKNRKSYVYRGTRCLNCDSALQRTDQFCHSCGQLNSTKKLALTDFIEEFFGNFISYDSKIWRTIKHILFRPGYVSKAYIEGRRSEYANPFRFFFSVCIVFFIGLKLNDMIETYVLDTTTKSIENTNNFIKIDTNKSKNKNSNKSDSSYIDPIELKKIEKLFGNKTITDAIQKKQLNYEPVAIDSISKSKKTVSQSQLDNSYRLKMIGDQLDYYIDYYEKTGETDASIALSSLKHKNSKYNQQLYLKAVALDKLQDSNFKDFDQIIIPNIPLFLFLFTPFITLIFWLAYIRKPITYMEHLVFVYNLSAFVFLLMILHLILSVTVEGISEIMKFIYFIGIPLYLYKSLRVFYKQNRFKTIVKFLFINFAYSIVISIGTVILVIISIIFTTT